VAKEIKVAVCHIPRLAVCGTGLTESRTRLLLYPDPDPDSFMTKIWNKSVKKSDFFENF
jgi:hypothetical protein